MFTVRCTQKLLRRVESTDEPTAPTTVLGDWYANVLYSRPHQLVLCVSERSLLPVVMYAKEAHTLAGRLAVTAGEVLRRLRVAPTLIEKEQNEMRTFAYSRTQNRKVLGQLNELMFQLSWYLHDRPEKSLLAHSLHLAETPCGAIDGFPDKLTVELFQAAAANAEAYH
jgi:prophage antirepressor-like protein